MVRALLDAGADAAPALGWSPLHRAVALGTAEDVAPPPRHVRRLRLRDLLESDALASSRCRRATLAKAEARRCEPRAPTSSSAIATVAPPSITARSTAPIPRSCAGSVELGCDPDETDESSVTPLHDAAVAGETEILRVLLDAGARR